MVTPSFEIYDTDLPEVFVLGMSVTGLSVGRSLGRRGVPVTGIDYDPRKIGFRSRYCRKAVCPHPRKAEDLFLRFLAEKGRTAGNKKSVIIPTNDEFLLCVSRNRDVLDEHFVHDLPPKEIVENLTNKESFYHIATKYKYPVPRTYFPKDEKEIHEIVEQMEYPCLIKLKYGFYAQELGVKAIKINSKDNLIDVYRDVNRKSNDIMVQEMVQGDDRDQYSLYSYIGRDSAVVASMASRKLRQYPVEFGVGTMVMSCDEPAVEELGISLLAKVGYKGLSEIELKRDCRDDQYKIIEVNARPWMQISLGTRCGIDFCWLWYMDSIGRRVKVVPPVKNNVKWVCFESDFYACFGSSGYVRRGAVSRKEWILSLRGEKEFAYWTSEDVRPFLWKLYSFCKDLIGVAIRRLISVVHGTSRLKESRGTTC